MTHMEYLERMTVRVVLATAIAVGLLVIVVGAKLLLGCLR